MRFLIVFSSVLLPFLLSLPSYGQVRGKFIQMTGGVQILRGVKTFSSYPRGEFRQGDQILVQAGATTALVFYRSGQRFDLPAGSQVVVLESNLQHRAGPPPKQGVAISRSLLKLSARTVPNISSRPFGEVFRSESKWLITEALPRGASPSSAVTLHWKVEGPAPSEEQESPRELTLTLYDTKSRVQIVRALLPITTQEYHIPAGKLRLGREYLWQVELKTSGARAFGGGPLRLLTAAERQALSQEEKAALAAQAAAPDDPLPCLFLAETYYRYRLYDQAIAACEATLKKGPDDRVQKMLDTLHQLP